MSGLMVRPIFAASIVSAGPVCGRPPGAARSPATAPTSGAASSTDRRAQGNTTRMERIVGYRIAPAPRAVPDAAVGRAGRWSGVRRAVWPGARLDHLGRRGVHRRDRPQTSGAEVLVGLDALVAGVHDERPEPRDRFADRPAPEEQHL